MSKISDSLRRVRFFLMEVRNELKKSTWPTRNELLESTAVVILSVILFSVFVGVVDWFLVRGLSLIMR